ncbi:hypothetical protein PFZ49_07425 [Microbacterium lacticum]|uniref:hypothetical protein n=1 Tax=Microbacterium lacticum TaxID=33885 RepID=UPI003A842C88
MSGRPASTARILTGVLGAAAVALGVFLALRPLTTLQVTVWAAAAALVGWAVVLGRGARGRAWPWALAAVLVVGAAALVVFTPYVIRACPAVLAALLALNAVRLLVRGLRPRRTRSTTSRAGAVTDRIVDVVVAAASLAAAVLVWLWPAVVALPSAPAPSGGRTTLAWQHGTTGVARACAPSLETNALSEYAIPGISRMIDR